MINKKGMGPGKLLNLVLAVICIILLVVLAVKLYGLYQNKTRSEQAKAGLEEINAKVATLKEGEKISSVLLSPSGYMLVGWPLEDGTRMPDVCTKNGWKNCLCFCEYPENVGKGDYFSLTDLLAPVQVWKSVANGIDFFKTVLGTENYFYKICSGNKVVCRNSDKPLKVDGTSMNVEEAKAAASASIFENLRSAEKIDAASRAFARSGSIAVDDLIRFKKNLGIKLEGGKYIFTAG